MFQVPRWGGRLLPNMVLFIIYVTDYPDDLLILDKLKLGSYILLIVKIKNRKHLSLVWLLFWKPERPSSCMRSSPSSWRLHQSARLREQAAQSARTEDGLCASPDAPPTCQQDSPRTSRDKSHISNILLFCFFFTARSNQTSRGWEVVGPSLR